LVGVQPKLTQVPEQLALDDRDLHPGLAAEARNGRLGLRR
jgi:hypothetical protein